MSDWVEQSFDQIKQTGKFEVKQGTGDQAIIEQVLKEFSQDVAYSGVVAAYSRVQEPVESRGEGPLATKFDLLIFHYDQTGELLTNSEARREVQTLIVNLCGGTERYKFFYGERAEDYEVAGLVEAAVGLWGRSQSKQAKKDQALQKKDQAFQLLERQRGLNQKLVENGPAPEAAQGPAWGDEQKQAAAEFYKKLKDQEKNKVDALARAILDSGSEPEMVEAVINSLPNTRELIDVSGRKEDVDWIIERQTPRVQGKDEIVAALKPVLLLKKLPGENSRLKAVEANWEFYDGLADALRWQAERLGEEKEIRKGILERAERLSMRLGEKGKGNIIVEIDGEVNQLVEDAEQAQAEDLSVALNGVTKEVNPQAKGVSDNIDLIRVSLDNGWRSGKSEFRYLPFDEKTGDKLTAVATMVDLKRLELIRGHSFVKEGDDFKIARDGQFVAKVTTTDGGKIVFDWAEGVTPEQGLTAMAVLGLGFNDFIGSDEKFPALFLELAEPEPTEPTGTVPAGEKTELPTEETSGSDLEVPEPALIETSSQAPEMPDWLKALQEVPSIPAEPPVEETQAPFVPEAPKPVLVEKSRSPIEEVARVIKEKGTADFEFDQVSAHNLFSETLGNVVRDLYIPGLTINSQGISQFLISGGQIRLSVSAGGSFKKGILPAVGVSASIKFDLTSHLDLLGDPEIDLPRLAPKEARGLISDQLKQIKVELSRTIIRGLSANKISNANVENLGVANSSLVAKIRGKASR